MKETALGVLFFVLGAIVVLMLIVIAVVFAPAKAASKAPVNGFGSGTNKSLKRTHDGGYHWYHDEDEE